MKSHDEHTNDPRAELRQRIVADLLGESDAAEHAALEAQLAADPELAAERARLAATIGLVSGIAAEVPAERLSPEAAARLANAATGGGRVLPGPGSRPWYATSAFRAAAGFALVLGAFALWRGAQDRLSPAEGLATADARGSQVRRAAGEPYVYDVFGESEPKRRAQNDLAPQDAPFEGAVAKSAAPVSLEEVAEAPALDADRNRQLTSLGYGLEASPAPKLEDRFKNRLGDSEQLALASTAPSSGPATPAAPAGAVLGGERDKGTYIGPGDSVPPGSSGRFGGGSAGGKDAAEPALAAGVAAGKEVGGSRGYARAMPVAPAAEGAVASGSDEYFLGRGEAETSAESRFDDKAFNDVIDTGEALERLRGLGYVGASDDEDDLRARARLQELGYGGNDGVRYDQSPLTPQQRARAIELLLADCRRRPNEPPRDMFYRWWGDNPFEYARTDSLSTFSVDVDTASYTLARRYLVDGHLPTKQQVRTEEFVNYFKGDVPAPSEETFAVTTELAPSPFNRAGDAWTMRVVLRGREVSRAERQPLALTFVVDVSGSMKKENRLELVKHAMRLLVGELDARDSIAIVAFTNDARLILPMTSARNRGLIESAIHPLAPQGGTNVQAGLRMGYEAALAGLDPEAHNRVVFLSDGVGNIGQTDAEALNREVESARKRGVWLNTIGVGMGNHNDAFLEQLADKGDGICNYVDDEREARRALVENFTGAFEPIAKDVKIQVEFDSEQVERYRLLGYENRAIADADFRNDAVDAGEVGAGHQVVALYEIVRTGQGDGPLATVRVRWKPAGATLASNQLADLPAREAAWTIDGSRAGGSFAATSAGFRRSVLVAQLAEVLRRSIHARDDSLETLLSESRKLAPELADPDFDEFVKMVERTIELIATDWGRYDSLARRLDQLRMQNYLKAKLEDVARDLDQARLQELDAQIRDLESEIRTELERDTDRFPKSKVR